MVGSGRSTRSSKLTVSGLMSAAWEVSPPPFTVLDDDILKPPDLRHIRALFVARPFRSIKAEP